MKLSLVCFFSLLFFCSLPVYSTAQSKEISRSDSLFHALKQAGTTRDKIEALNELAGELRNSQADTSLYFAREAYRLSLKTQYKKGEADALLVIGVIISNKGNYDEAIEHVNAALLLYEPLIASAKGENKTDLLDKKARAYNCIGLINLYQGVYDKGIENFIAAAKIWEKTGNKIGIAACYNNMGLVYRSQGKYEDALKSIRESLRLSKSIRDLQGQANAYNNIGIVYRSQGHYEKAFKNYEASLKIERALGNKIGEADSYLSIGVLYYQQKNYAKSLKNYFYSLEIYKETGEKQRIALAYRNIAYAYLEQKKLREANQTFAASLDISREIKSKDDIKEAYLGLSLGDSAAGNWFNAYENYKSYKLYNDSIFNEESAKKTEELNTRYKTGQKETQIKLLEKDKEKQAAITAAEKARQNTILLSVLSGAALIAIFTIFMFNRWKVTQKQNRIIEFQKAEVEHAKKIIEEKNKDITDSINYAQRIQQFKLPLKEDIYAEIPHCFVLYKPKDIVSGDFYFFHRNEIQAEEKPNLFIAAADCTGHGVPGAFMSLIGSEKLEQAVTHYSDTSVILNHLNKGIRTTLRQSENDASSRDGMDIALCAIHMENRNVEYAGANRPLWLIRQGGPEVEEIKATKKAIGGFTPDDQLFEKHTLNLKKGDTIYIFSDGYADTFSGENGKKLTTKKFKETLLNIQELAMQEQEKHLDEFIETWKAGTEQVDDILVIGIRL